MLFRNDGHYPRRPAAINCVAAARPPPLHGPALSWENRFISPGLRCSTRSAQRLGNFVDFSTAGAKTVDYSFGKGDAGL
jgi:hypothetical protein